MRRKILIGLTVLPKHVKRCAAMDTDLAREQVVEDILRRLMGPEESEAIILVPSLVGSIHSPRHGRWDEDEPHPHPDLPFSDH